MVKQVYPEDRSSRSRNTPDPPSAGWSGFIVAFSIIAAFVIVSLAADANAGGTGNGAAHSIHRASIGQVFTWLQQHRLKAAVIQGDQVTVTMTNGTRYQATKEQGQQLAQYLLDHGVNDVTVRPSEASPIWQQLALSAAPLAVLALMVMAIVWFANRRSSTQGGDSLMSVGRSRASRFNEVHPRVQFKDVAGVEEAKEELQEIVSFLKAPARFERLGARVPKGVLLVGSPGTGKTLIARAVAGEAGVAFFSANGSEFVELYVGIGASRVRDMFANAKQHAPCIIFIDEIDAVGRHRNASPVNGNEERDQTLNQLLVEIDGFEPHDYVVVVAATNRPDVLDQALLRPGRFDRQVLLDKPDLAGRLAILQVHSVRKPLSPGVSLDQLAEQTSGFSGADLANVMNEGALLAARQGHERIEQHDLEEAVLRVTAGPERKSHVLGPAEKAVVAYHELGHAVVMRLLPGCDVVRKVTTVSRGMALGLTVAAPSEDRALLREGELKARLAGLMGGRAAEELIFGNITTGAAQDIKQATAIARRMVCEFGMSRLGNVLISEEAGIGPELATQVDTEVVALLEQAHETAKNILRAYREKLFHLAEHLIRVETIDGAEFNRLLFGDDAQTVREFQPCSEDRSSFGGPAHARTPNS